ncbi:MAG: FtsW/RodA/SpoVE family cell cycle protein [Eubacteriales bacterium]
MNNLGKGLKIFIKETDKILLFLCLLTSSFGVIMVHSATINSLTEGKPISRYTLIMIIAITLGLTLCFIISLIDYEIILRMWPVIAIACLLLMFALFKWGEGPNGRSDAKSWLPLPFAGGNFQPSELLKIGFVLTFTIHLDAVRGKINELRSIIFLGIHGLIPIGLVVLTGDLGSALVFVAIFLGMLFISGIYLRYFIGGFAVCLVALPMLWIKFFSIFQKQRFLAVYYPKALSTTVYKALIYQQQQSVNAIGSGQLFGKGLFEGPYTQNNLIPVDESDMIFSVIGEELGFIGCICVLLLLAMIILRIVMVGRKAKDFTGSIICYGIAILIGGQSIINIGMCLKLLPSIGITLPFFSAGGSSNLCVYIGIGIIMSIYRANQDSSPVNFRLSHIRTPFSEA